jgi:hypothetical protein
MMKLLAATLALALAAPALAADEPGTFKIPGTNTTLKLNGYVQFDTTYDFSGATEDIRGTDWASFLETQPLDDDPLQKAYPNRLYMTARTSRIGLTTNTPVGAKALTVRLEGDFNDPSAFNFSTEPTTNGMGFRLRHAYAEYGGLLVGQTWSNFVDLGSLPDTVDFNGHGGFGASRTPMVRYALPIGKGGLSVSLENPQSLVWNAQYPESFTVGRQYDRMPVLTGSLTMPFALGHVNVRGIAMEYQGKLPVVDGDGDPLPPTAFPGAEDSTIGWGVGASGSVKLGPATLVLSGQGGKGIGYYTFQSLLQTAAFVEDKIELWTHWTYHAGVTLPLGPSARANVIWTQTFWKEDAALAQASFGALGDIGVNKSLNSIYVNAFYSPFKNAELGLEYNWGQRKIFEDFAAAGNDTGTQSRVNALARYSFF